MHKYLHREEIFCGYSVEAEPIALSFVQVQYFLHNDLGSHDRHQKLVSVRTVSDSPQ